MFGSIIVWLKSLSLAGKVGLISVGLFSAGAVTSSITPQTVDTVDAVPAQAQDVKSEERTVEMVAETKAVPFTKKTIETSSLNKGVTKVSTLGIDGVRTLTYKVTKINGLETDRSLISDEVTSPAVEEIISVGTYVAPVVVAKPSNCDPNYTPCVPNVSYDLDCPDIGFSVRVIGSDPHGFDRDRDGYGCESY